MNLLSDRKKSADSLSAENLTLFRLCLICFFLTPQLPACVSVSLSSQNVVNSENYSFKAPGDGFKESKVSEGDKSWSHKDTGVMIGLLTECSKISYEPLELIANQTLSPIRKLEVQEKTETRSNQRKALSMSTTGEIDGVPVRSELFVFRKHQCTYILTLSGRLNQVQGHLPAFQNFIDGFRVP